MLRNLTIIFPIFFAGILVCMPGLAYSQTSGIGDSIVYSGDHPAGPIVLTSLEFKSPAVTFGSVHTWPGSKCRLCHLAEDPNVDPMLFVESDQSLLCVSCHPRNIIVPSGNGSGMGNHGYSNHPIKFSPLDFDSDRINHNIIEKNGTFYLSWLTGELPIFGDTEDSAVAECSTCHDPHGRTTVPLLGRFDNEEGGLCIVCHITIKPRKT